jgi:hypothetical protein
VQHLLGLTIDLTRRGAELSSPAVGDDGLEHVLEWSGRPRVVRVEVPQLPVVDTEVVQLGTRRLDPLPPVVPHAEERGHAEALLGQPGLGVLRQVDRASATLEGSQQVGSLRRLDTGEPEDRQHRRHDVDVANGPGIGHARGEHARQAPEERHADRRVVDEDAVRRLAVLAEALAVVGGEDDQRIVEHSVLP